MEIIAKSDSIRHTVILEVIMTCLGPKYCMRNICLFVTLFFAFYLVYLVALHSTVDDE